jgi:hypothetical protein
MRMSIFLAAALAAQPAQVERLEIDGPGFRQSQLIISIKEPRGGELQIGCIKTVKSTFRIRFIPRGRTDWWAQYEMEHTVTNSRSDVAHSFGDGPSEPDSGHFYEDAFLITRLLKDASLRANFLDNLSKESLLRFRYKDPVGFTYTANFHYTPDPEAIEDIVRICQPKKVMQKMRELGWKFDAVPQ